MGSAVEKGEGGLRMRCPTEKEAPPMRAGPKVLRTFQTIITQSPEEQHISANGDWPRPADLHGAQCDYDGNQFRHSRVLR